MTTLTAVGKVSFVGYIITIFMTAILTAIIEGLCLWFSNWKLYGIDGHVVFDIEPEMKKVKNAIVDTISEVYGIQRSTSSRSDVKIPEEYNDFIDKINSTYENTGSVQQKGNGPKI
jgi:hypothetical protein